MRRKDREMDRDFGLEVIDKAAYAVLSVTDQHGKPYAIPLSVVRKGNELYFHSAKSGTKVTLFASHPVVCLTFVCDVHVPDFLSDNELKGMQSEGKVSAIISHVFTTEYASAIVYGSLSTVNDDTEKREALRILCEKYTPDKMFLFDAAVESGMQYTNVYRVVIETLTAKRKKFDRNGEEMKWGRMK